MKAFKAYYLSPIGPVEVSGTLEGIVSVNFVKQRLPNDRNLPDCVKEGIQQLDEYFRGVRKDFSLKLLLHGTPFQKLVWQQLKKISYGKVASYGDVARAIGKPHAYRAVETPTTRIRSPSLSPATESSVRTATLSAMEAGCGANSGC